ncbi:hypothetical protein MKX01_021837 [Papaver californicum]|nr:hypothetical protein MKX01_021837 [Papaver californicum]
MDDDPQPPATKKSRGVAKLNFLTKVKKGEKVALEFCQREPAGPNTKNFPFDIHDWSEMPDKEEKIEEAIAELKNVFNYSDEINVSVEKKIHEKWKATKANKRKMKLLILSGQICVNIGVHLNSRRRVRMAKQVESIWLSLHAGTKSFVNHAIEIETTTQKKANKAAVFRKSYRAKEGKTPNPIAEENRAQMEAL